MRIRPDSLHETRRKAHSSQVWKKYTVGEQICALAVAFTIVFVYGLCVIGDSIDSQLCRRSRRVRRKSRATAFFDV